jgi:hypothetical protein
MGNDLAATFKRVVLFSVLAALLGVGIVYGLSYEFKPAKSAQTLPTSVSVEGVGDLAGLELTMTLEKTEYTLGEPINITFAVTNISNQTITFSESPQNFDCYIFDNMNSTFYNNMNNISYMRSILLSNTTVYWWQSARKIQPIEWSASLNAGESLTESLVWGQTYSSPLVLPDEDVAVPPGTYYIVGLGLGSGLRTPPLQVTIDNT